MINKYRNKIINFILSFSLTFLIGLVYLPVSPFVRSASAVLPAVALPAAVNAAMAAGRLLLVNGTRIAASTTTGGAANGAIYGTAAANGAIYGTVAANAAEFIVPTVASVSNAAATGGISGYWAAAALGAAAFAGGAVQYIRSDGSVVDVSGSEGQVSADFPITYGESPNDFNFLKERGNQVKAELRDPSVAKPKLDPNIRYVMDGKEYDTVGSACSEYVSYLSARPQPQCSDGSTRATSYKLVRVIGLTCYFSNTYEESCSKPRETITSYGHFSVDQVVKGVKVSCPSGTRPLSQSSSTTCVPTYNKDKNWYPNFPDSSPLDDSNAPTFEIRPVPSGLSSTPTPANSSSPPPSVLPHPSIVPYQNQDGQIPLANSNKPETQTKAEPKPDGSLEILEQIRDLLIDINIKMDRANDLAAENNELLHVVERKITGGQLKHEEDGSKEPVTIVNNTYFDAAGNEYNITYVIRENPSANKPVTPGDRFVLPDGTVIEPNYDPSNYPPIETETTTRPLPTPSPDPNANPDTNPDTNPNPNPAPTEDTVTKTKVDPNTGDVIEEVTRTVTKPDGSKEITVTINVNPDTVSDTPSPAEFEWKCGIEGTPPCAVTQDVGKLADSDWSDVDVPPATYAQQLKEKLFGKLFENFSYTPPISSTCPIFKVDLAFMRVADQQWFSQPLIFDYHCKNLFEPLYSQFRSLFKLCWIILAVLIVLSA